jgi:hypothetical protein
MNKKAPAYKSWTRFISFSLKVGLGAISLNATIDNTPELNYQNR